VDTTVEAAPAVDWFAAARAVTVLTGAGVSTDSGIPDYRGPTGLWRRDPDAIRLSTLQDYLSDPDVRRRAWERRRAHPAWQARPNAAHRALVALERQGRLHALLTQNVDGLHQLAGSDPSRVVELHGTIWEAECVRCAARTPMRDELARLDEEPDPPCRSCGGVLKSATISFGQPLQPGVLTHARRCAAAGDVFLAVGSSLTVQPAAGLCGVAHESGARVVIVNAEATPYDPVADAVLRGPVGGLLPALVATG
jgi:NAD-dependent deacetylase